MADRSGGDFPTQIQEDDPRLLPPEERVSRALFGALHERTVESFSQRVGFGFSRMLAPRNHIGVEELWTIMPPESARYEVALIGLESEPKGTVYSIEVVEEEFVLEMPGEETQPLEHSGEVVLAEFGDITLIELANPKRLVNHEPASDLDREMLGLLAAKGEAPMLVDDSGERVMIYGAVRATQQRCIACHECEPDTLLGAFRYVFEMPDDSDGDALAASSH